MKPGFVVILGSVLFAPPALGQLPVIEQADAAALRASCDRLVAALEALDASLPAETEKGLRDALANRTLEPSVLIEKVQALLDPHCLVMVTINPESRVKVARGPAKAELLQGEWAVRLIKIHNEAGVTQALGLTSPQLRPAAEGWLDALIYHRPLVPEKLSGHELEYLIVRLRSAETGKREARLTFDVGQGTQDLGFRAEVPVLFTIKPKRP